MKQTELPYMVEAKERERLLQAVEFPGKRNRTLIAALLRTVASYPAGRCFVSQEAFARMFKVDRKTIQRAFAYLSSDEMNLIAIGLVGRMIDGEAKTLNCYSVNWPALKDIVASQSASVNDGTVTEPEPSKALGHLEPTDGTVTHERWDTCARPMGHLTPTDGTSDCPTTITDLNTDFNEQLTEPVVVDTSHEWTREQTQRIHELLLMAGCKSDLNRAINSAKKRGWTFAKALDVYEQREPDRPDKLFNWFAVNGSWERHLASKTSVEHSSIDRQNHQRGDALKRDQVQALVVEGPQLRAVAKGLPSLSEEFRNRMKLAMEVNA
jgi:hypothetical protein